MKSRRILLAHACMGGRAESLGLDLRSHPSLHAPLLSLLSPPCPPRHLCLKERNLLLSEMAWKRVPKDADEQKVWGIPKGSSKEEDPHRLRYNEVHKTLKRIRGVLR